MTAGRLSNLALVATLLAVGAVAWWLELAPRLEVDPSPLAGLPREIGAWRAQDVPLEPAVEAVLRADYNLQRVYQHPTGATVWVYVGYYGTARGGRPEHTPRGCYTGAGWGIEAARTLEAAPGDRLRVNEYLVEREGERRLVHFWFRSHRRTGMLGGIDQNLDRLIGRLADGRADGALVRVSTSLAGEDPITARSRLRSFAADLDASLDGRWPLERRSG